MGDHWQITIPRSTISLSPSCGSIVALRDGRLMLAWGQGGGDPPRAVMANHSEDGGRSWSAAQPLKLDSGADLVAVVAPQLLRLASGDLGLVVSIWPRGVPWFESFTQMLFHLSRDEGVTWSQGVPINQNNGFTLAETTGAVDGLVQLESGRLVVSAAKAMGAIPDKLKLIVEDEFGEPMVAGLADRLVHSYAYYSDDEGRTWSRSMNEVHASLEHGLGGAFTMGEPRVVELADGRLLLMAWTPLGRLFRSYSDDRGETWRHAWPTDLATRIGGCFALERIPDSSDLLVIWCQLSRLESMQGLYRHRLSTAISRDDGVSWQHHRNLVSLDDVTRIDPGPMVHWLTAAVARQPVDRQRYHRAPGPLRNDHVYCTFHEGEALIVHGQGVLGDRAVIEGTYGMDWDALAESFGFEPNPGKANSVLGSNREHIVPISWFYGE